MTNQHIMKTRRTTTDLERPELSPTIAALTRAFALLGKRWNGLVLAALAKGPGGFGEVRERVPGISDRMLAERLHELAVAGLITRTVHHGPPLRSSYALTPHGNAFLIPSPLWRSGPRNICRHTPTGCASGPWHGGPEARQPRRSAIARVISRVMRTMPGERTGQGFGVDVVGARQKCR